MTSAKFHYTPAKPNRDKIKGDKKVGILSSNPEALLPEIPTNSLKVFVNSSVSVVFYLHDNSKMRLSACFQKLG